jgi:hypothetical protein
MSKNGKAGKGYSGINSMDAPTDDGRGFFSEESGSDNIIDVDGQEEDEVVELDFGHNNL